MTASLHPGSLLLCIILSLPCPRLPEAFLHTVDLHSTDFTSSSVSHTRTPLSLRIPSCPLQHSHSDSSDALVSLYYSTHTHTHIHLSLSLTHTQNSPSSKVVVLCSSAATRTPKVMFALARGLLPVKPDWVYECIRQRKLLPVSESFRHTPPCPAKEGTVLVWVLAYGYQTYLAFPVFCMPLALR